MNKLFINWKTTSLGVTTIVGSIATALYAWKAKALNVELITATSTGICMGLGLIFARDFNKSSEQSGVVNTVETKKVE
jgi:hypothetical protein